jgi:hypothetical protein
MDQTLSPHHCKKSRERKQKDSSELLRGNAECKLLCGGVAAGVLLCGGDETGA